MTHKPVQRQAHTKWFSTFYIRKWRLPAEGEPFGDRILNETHLMPSAALEPAQLRADGLQRDWVYEGAQGAS